VSIKSHGDWILTGTAPINAYGLQWSDDGFVGNNANNVLIGYGGMMSWTARRDKDRVNEEDENFARIAAGCREHDLGAALACD
jgi:hypothetical protein